MFDALDECAAVDRNDLIEKLNSFMTDQYQNQSRIKFLVTTRGYPQILDKFSLSSDMIHLSGDGKAEKDQIQSEISLVLDFKLNELAEKRDLKPAQDYTMRQSLRLKCDEQRTYLWLKLVFEVLDRTFPRSAKDWKKHIVNPPGTVFKAYEALLNQVSKNEGDRESIRVLFHLIIAAHRPLTLREMNVAINVREYLGSRDESSMDLLSDSQFKSWLINTCGFFVTVYDDRVFLIHQTAKEFLMGSHPDPARGSKAVVSNIGQSDWYGSVTSQKADACMAESCIAYLSLEQFSDEAFYGRAQKYYHDYASCERIRERPDFKWEYIVEDKGLGLLQQRASLFGGCDFLTYTIGSWIKHFHSFQMYNGAIVDIGEIFIPYYTQIFSARRKKAPGWLFLTLMALRKPARRVVCKCGCNLRSGSEKFFVENYTLGRAAFWFDHPRLLQHALDQDSGDPAVFCFHHCRIAQDFVSGEYDERREDVGDWEHWRSNGYCEPESHISLLHTAARFGAYNCARFVLERGSDINERDSRGFTPLCVVARRLPKLCPWERTISLLDLLLDYGADTKNASSPHNSALFILLRLTHCDANQDHRYDLKYYRKDTDCIAASASIIRRIVRAGVDRSALVRAVQLSISFEMYGLMSIAYDDQVDDLISEFFDQCGDLQLDKVRHIVSQAYNDSLVKVFQDHGADINAVWEQKTALESRLDQSHKPDLVQLDVAVLLHAGADMRIHMDTDRSALDIVLRQGDVNLIAMLLNHDPVPEYINRPVDVMSLETRLHRASVHCGAAELLLRFGAQLEAQDRHGQTALHHSIRAGWGNSPVWRPDPTTSIREVIRLLYGRGADINARDHNGNTPLHKACHQELAFQPGQELPHEPTESIVELLIELGADCTATNGKGETPLHVACKHSSPDTVFFLLENGRADIITRDGDGRLPLEIALQARKFKSASWLIRYGADLSNVLRRDDVEARDESDLCKTLLHCVCEWNLIDAAKLLLRHCADPNSRNTEGVTPFSAAVKEYTPDYIPLLQLLLDAGADIESQTSDFHTPLISACCSQNSDAVKFLLGHGAKLTGHGEQPRTVLAWACKSSSPQIVESLLQCGAEIEFKESRVGKTLLLALAKSWREVERYDQIIGELRFRSELDNRGERGPQCKKARSSDCHCRNCLDQRFAPLHESYKKPEERVCDIVRALLDAGAWPMTREVEEGWTPFELAKKGHWMRLAEIFQEAVPGFRRRTLPHNLRRHSFHCTSASQVPCEDLVENPQMTTPLQFRTHGTVMDLARARGYNGIV